MAKLHRLQAHGSGGLVSMRNTYTAAERAARAPDDDAVALKELNRRSLHVCPSGHKTEDIPAVWRGGCYCLETSAAETYLCAAHFGGNAISTGDTTILVHLEQSFGRCYLVRCLPSEATSEQQTT